MQTQRCDRTNENPATAISRRRRRRLWWSVAVGATLALLWLAPAAAAPNACAQACAGEPKGPRQAACKQACKQCDGNISLVCSGPQIICCATGDCCLDENGQSACSDELSPCPESQTRVGCDCVDACSSGEPAENCSAGVTSSCGTFGTCALVRFAGSLACNCIERVCTNTPCTTTADCPLGQTCASLPGCCSVSPTCVIDCGG